MSERGPEEELQDREEMLVDGRDESSDELIDEPEPMGEELLMVYRDAQPGIGG